MVEETKESGRMKGLVTVKIEVVFASYSDAERERARRVAEYGTSHVPSPCCTAIARELPRNVTQCAEGDAIGAFAVGSFASPAPARAAVVALAEAERVRRVSLYGTKPARSPCAAAVSRDLPRNLVACDPCLTPYGAFATASFCPPKQSGLAALLDDDHLDHDDQEPLVADIRKAVSECDLFLLSTSPTSVTASASVGNLQALVA